MDITYQRILTNELQIGDIVGCSETSPFNTGVVIQIRDNMVTIFRPYVHTSDFISVSGIIPYVGFEQFSVPQSHHSLWTLIERRKRPLK